MHEILDLPDSNLIGITLSDSLTEDDFEALVPYLENELERHTTTRVLFELDDVDGWAPEEQWEDLAFDIRHVQDLDRIAIVGDDPWETWIEKVEFLFPTAQLQTYATEDRDEALSWLRGEMEVPGIGPGSVSDPKAGAQDES